MQNAYDETTPFSTIALDCARDILVIALWAIAIIAAGAALYFSAPHAWDFTKFLVFTFGAAVTRDYTSVWPAYSVSLICVSVAAWCLCVRAKLVGRAGIARRLGALFAAATIISILSVGAAGTTLVGGLEDGWPVVPAVAFVICSIIQLLMIANSPDSNDAVRK